jgi:hypothetical protein
MYVYSIWQTVDVFLMSVILALTVALFFRPMRVWESMVLRIGKERVNLPIYVLL